jgi:predicted nucleotidyltransferase
MNITEDKLYKIRDLCKKHMVKELYLFGSALSDDFRATSDIDFLVEFSGVNLEDYFTNFITFKSSLESLLDRQVDLVEPQAIRNPIFKRSVNRNKQLVYGREIA